MKLPGHGDGDGVGDVESPSVTLTPMLKLLLSYSSHRINAEHVAAAAKNHLHVPVSRERYAWTFGYVI